MGCVSKREKSPNFMIRARCFMEETSGSIEKKKLKNIKSTLPSVPVYIRCHVFFCFLFLPFM